MDHTETMWPVKRAPPIADLFHRDHLASWKTDQHHEKQIARVASVL